MATNPSSEQRSGSPTPTLTQGSPDSTESDKKQELRQELIKHLSSEIATEMRYLATLRTRVVFTVLTGPFIIIGSLLVAYKGPLTLTTSHRTTVAVWSALLAYFGLGLYGAMFDFHSTNQCNKWRKAIASLLEGKDVAESDLHFEHYARTAYLTGFFLVMVAFLALVFLIMQIVPSQTPHEQERLLLVHKVYADMGR